MYIYIYNTITYTKNISCFIYPVHFCVFCTCINSCESPTFYTIFDILHGRNLQHNYKIIYDIEINLHLDITICYICFTKKIIVFYKY